MLDACLEVVLVLSLWQHQAVLTFFFFHLFCTPMCNCVAAAAAAAAAAAVVCFFFFQVFAMSVRNPNGLRPFTTGRIPQQLRLAQPILFYNPNPFPVKVRALGDENRGIGCLSVCVCVRVWEGAIRNGDGSDGCHVLHSHAHDTQHSKTLRFMFRLKKLCRAPKRFSST